MQLRWTLAAVTLAAAAAAGPAQANDPVENLLVQAEDTAHQALTTAGSAVDGLDRVVVVGPAPTPRQARVLGTADSITIKGTGAGITVTYGGVLNTLWDCSETMNIGAPVVATCTPKPNANIDWTCGYMGVSAFSHSRVIDFYRHAVDVLRTPPTARYDAGPSVPDPRPKQWGEVAGVVRCDSHELKTAQANRSNPTPPTVAVTMGAVSTFTCEARRGPNDLRSPIPDYTVVCVDPVNPNAVS